MPAGVVNGSLTKGAKRQAVIDALVQGDSHAAIARRLHKSREVIAAIEREEFDTVSQRKERLAVLSERGAMLAGERLIAAIERGDIKGAALVAPFGVFTDKALALRGDGIIKVQHDHTHRISADDILGFAVQRSQQIKQAKARTLPQDTTPALTERSAQMARKTGLDQGSDRGKKRPGDQATAARQAGTRPRKKSSPPADSL